MGIPTFVTNPDPWIYHSQNFVVLDIETTNLDKGDALNNDNRLLLYTIYNNNNNSIITEWANEYQCSSLIQTLYDADFVIAHNVKFEIHWMKRCGMDISKVLWFDTMLGEYVLYSNQGKPLGLGAVASRRGLGDKDKYIDTCMKRGICPSELPRSLVRRRNRLDVRQTLGIFKQQLQELTESDKLGVLYTKCLLTPVLADIETRGVCLDKDRVNEEYYRLSSEVSDYKRQLEDIAGGINFKSPPQMANFIYGKLGFKELKNRRGEVIRNKPSKQFPDGAPKVDVHTLNALKASTKEQKDFIELRAKYIKSADALSKYLLFYKGVVDYYDGVFYGQFNQAVTATQRLSSSGKKLSAPIFDGKEKAVQFQNQPRGYKKLVKAKSDDYLVCEPDGAQLEFRVAGHLGRDVQVIQDIIDGVDVHQFTADTMTASGQPTSRQEAKSRTFKPLYGGESGTKAEQEYYAAFKKRYSGVAQTQADWIGHVVNHKSLVTETGLEFYWADTKITRSGYTTNRESICNYPVQYLATGEIIPIAMIKLWHELLNNSLRSSIINTVHDSSPMEVHKDEVEQVRELIIEAYTDYVYFYLDKVYGIEFLAPLGVGIKIGDHWGEGEEEKIQVNPPTKLDGVNYGTND